MAKHLIVPDTQCKDGDNFEFLSWIGQYILDQRPDTVIHLGDFADMESLSSYDVGKKSFEGKRYIKDIQAAHVAMNIFVYRDWETDRKSTRLNSSHSAKSRMPSSA